ncbi:unnamed protein product [Adineta steineri]|uniref:Caspase family p20 domain-containing protein n=1 Tax=Adineta steineri TaxID=433720 RepID=A0A814FB00_9BILA|nr:unnamed protein product [Adineta steineri]
MASGFSSSDNSVYTKRALLIGNNEYKKNSQLQYCINDAEDLANKLYKIDFEITIGINLTYDQMNTMIKTFIDKIDQDDLVLFFFAGHGCQWNHLNFLIPIDDDDEIKTNTDLEYRAINAQVTLEKIINRRPSAAIFLLDCCRNSFVCESTNFNGLSSMQPIGDLFIGFSCTANKVALDKSKNGRNGLFTSHLLQHIDQPNLTIGEIMYGVCDGMMNETNNDQCPFRVSSLRRKVYLNQQFPIGQPTRVSPIYTNTKWKQHGITIAGGNDVGNDLNQLNSPQVRRWKQGDKNGELVAGGNGKGDHLNQLNEPTFIFIDEDYSLYISDCWNHRVMKWTKGAKEGIVVAGGNDCGNHRVMRWCEGAKEGEIIVGGNQSNQLKGPIGLSFDNEENLYVVDCHNHRIQKYEKLLN